jgi:hypothetical protein
VDWKCSEEREEGEKERTGVERGVRTDGSVDELKRLVRSQPKRKIESLIQ